MENTDACNRGGEFLGVFADTMSRYLIRRIDESPNITVHTHTELVALEGDDQLRSVAWRGPDGVETRALKHAFLMIGAQPNTAWLGDCVALDAQGFVKTGTDLSAEDLSSARWSLARAPFSSKRTGIASSRSVTFAPGT